MFRGERATLNASWPNPPESRAKTPCPAPFDQARHFANQINEMRHYET
jgi:hypothetical protein